MAGSSTCAQGKLLPGPGNALQKLSYSFDFRGIASLESIPLQEQPVTVAPEVQMVQAKKATRLAELQLWQKLRRMAAQCLVDEKSLQSFQA